ncbi:MAG: hypothetical protein MJ141_07435 [Clostridia bacterium]|nr:hypothetical protein [Clostridia bacterium]
MKNEKIVRAYDAVVPDEMEKERIFRKVMRGGSAASSEKRIFKGRKPRRVALTALITAALLSTLAVGGYAAAKKWSLPDPVPMGEGNDGFGSYEIHQTTTYGEEVLTSAEDPGETEEGEELDDVWFIREAIKILEAVGIEDISTDEMTVTRQNNLSYDREEAEVGFVAEDIGTTVTFHAKTGALLRISSIETFELEPLAKVSSDEEAEACARGYMEKLPVPQGYNLSGIEKYDEGFWSLDFSHEVEPGVFNVYEMVRIAINPQNGRMQNLVVFNFPLIDDHDESDAPLTQEEAVAIGAAEAFTGSWEDTYTLAKAEVEIVLPNWMFTDRMIIDAQYAENTRYAWVLQFENHEGIFDEIVRVWVDLYTGEVLGGDMT